jgi:hypothetical protein
MPDKEKKPYVNQPFDEETRRKAQELIEAGRMFEGGFWKNRSRTTQRLRYGEWNDVPEKIQQCLNQINRNASMRGKQRKQEEAKKAQEEANKQASTPPFALRSQGVFELSPDTLEDIRMGFLTIPKNASEQEIRTVREYITRASGFDPKRILLGVASHMEK